MGLIQDGYKSVLRGRGVIGEDVAERWSIGIIAGPLGWCNVINVINVCFWKRYHLREGAYHPDWI